MFVEKQKCWKNRRSKPLKSKTHPILLCRIRIRHTLKSFIPQPFCCRKIFHFPCTLGGGTCKKKGAKYYRYESKHTYISSLYAVAPQPLYHESPANSIRYSGQVLDATFEFLIPMLFLVLPCLCLYNSYIYVVLVYYEVYMGIFFFIDINCVLPAHTDTANPFMSVKKF